MYLNSQELALLRKLRITLAEVEDGYDLNTYRSLASEEINLAHLLETQGFCLGNGANGWRLTSHGDRVLWMERLRDENDQLRYALEPFALIWRRFEASGEGIFVLWLENYDSSGPTLRSSFEQAANVWKEREEE